MKYGTIRLWTIAASWTCSMAAVAQVPLLPSGSMTPARSMAPRADGFRDPKPGQLRAWREALSKGLPQDVIVTFRAAPEAAPRSAGGAELIERRALAYAAVKRSVLAGVEGEADVLHDYGHLPMSFVRLRTPAALERLQSHPDVEGIFENREQHLLALPNLNLIGQPAAASAGYDGTGVTVAVIDGPIDSTNSAFGCASPGNPASCGVAFFKSFGTGGNADARAHATNVGGIVREVAPGSKVISLDVFSGVQSTDSVWMQALDWCVANQAAYHIASINMSFGGGEFQAPCAPSSYETALAAVRAAGMIPVVAAGNDSSSKDGIAGPACAPSAVSVGAVYDANYSAYTWTLDPACTDPTTHADQVPCFSSSASFLSMLAPGVRVVASGTSYTGTSQAAPHVAGAVAALRAGAPEDSIGTTLRKLLAAGKPITDAANGVTTARLQLDTAALGPYPQCKTSAAALPFNLTGSLTNDTCSVESDSGLAYYGNVYTFDGAAGQQVSMALTSSTFDTYLYLEAPDGSVAATASSSPGTSRDSLLTHTLTATGTWKIVASSYWPASTGGYAIAAALGAPQNTCVQSATTLCLEGHRFAVTTTWQKHDGTTGTGSAIPMTDDTGGFWFFSPTNYEMVIKTLNGCALGGHYWVFAGGLTNVKVTMNVTDTQTRITKTYNNPLDAQFQPIQDTTAFSTCP